MPTQSPGVVGNTTLADQKNFQIISLTALHNRHFRAGLYFKNSFLLLVSILGCCLWLYQPLKTTMGADDKSAYATYLDVVLYKYPGNETGQGWTETVLKGFISGL